MNSISFLIVNYHTAPLVVTLVGTIRTFIKKYRYEILICDNSADMDERLQLGGITDEQCRLVIPEGNIGFVAANNLLVREANNDIIVLINPDTLLIDASLELLCDYLAAHHEIGAAGPMLLNGDGTYQTDHYRFPTLRTLAQEHLLFGSNPYVYADEAKGPQQCDVVKGACLAVRRAVVEMHGLFDPDIVMYSEEVGLCCRLTHRGLPSVYFPDARIVHYGEVSSAQASMYAVHHYNRSKILFWKHYHTTIEAGCARYIIYLSLLEKSIVLVLAGKWRSARINAAALRLVVAEFGI